MKTTQDKIYSIVGQLEAAIDNEQMTLDEYRALMKLLQQFASRELRAPAMVVSDQGKN